MRPKVEHPRNRDAYPAETHPVVAAVHAASGTFAVEAGATRHPSPGDGRVFDLRRKSSTKGRTPRTPEARIVEKLPPIVTDHAADCDEPPRPTEVFDLRPVYATKGRTPPGERRPGRISRGQRDLRGRGKRQARGGEPRGAPEARGPSPCSPASPPRGPALRLTSTPGCPSRKRAPSTGAWAPWPRPRSERRSERHAPQAAYRPDSIPSASSRSNSGLFCGMRRLGAPTRATPCPAARARPPAPATPPPTRRDRRTVHRAVPRAHPARSGETVRRPSRAYLRIRYGSAVSLNSDRSNGTMPDVGAEDQPRRLLVGAAAEPDEVRRARGRPGSPGRPGLVSCHAPISSSTSSRHALGDLAQQLPVRAVAEMARATRRRRSRRRIGRRERVGGQRHQRAPRRPPRGSRSPSASETTTVTAARRVAARCSSSSRSRWRREAS